MKLPLAPLAAAVLGGVTLFGVAALPGDVLEQLVTNSGLPSVLAAAEPPLGLTARIALALGSGVFVAGFTWLTLFVLLGNQAVALRRPAKPDMDGPFDMPPPPTIRRADAHPDAPPRPPLLATRDLGMPFPQEEGVKISIKMSLDDAPMPLVPSPTLPAEPAPVMVPAPITLKGEPALPRDLDQPLAAFDPQAIPAVPMPASVTPPPLLRPKPVVEAPRERFEVFELTPPVRAAAPLPPRAEAKPVRQEAIARPETEASVHALLDRLERGVSQQFQSRAAAAAQRPAGLEDTLASLRKLAHRA
jgi:hypothetical protein